MLGQNLPPLVGIPVNPVVTSLLYIGLRRNQGVLIDPNRWKGTPTEALHAVGINDELTNGELAEGDVGDNVVNGGEWSDDQLQFYQTYLAAQTQPGAVDGVAADTTTTTDGVAGDSA